MRETVDPGFAAYVDAREARWFGSAYLVYGEPERAEEQLLRAFTRLSMRCGKENDPDVFVQRLLFQPALSRWSRPKAFQDDEEDQPVKAALAGLSPVQRAVLVLLYFDELTEFEVSDVLGLSHAGHAHAALSQFRSGLGYGDWRNVEDRR